MIKRYFIIAGLLIGFFHHQASASDSDHLVTGTVYGIEQHADHQDTVALANANILWKNTTIGTITNSQGTFQLAPPDSVAQLIVSYIGFENDTLVVHPHDHSLTVFLDVIRSTEEVAVVAEKPHTIQHTEEVVNRHSITETGLQTLACCNLAESFENSAAVDVEQTDAISGAKRIKMLGLAGTYTQMMVEKVPSMRGLIAPYGLEYIPGYWIEAIDISKGTASVANGYESITGQINVELKKPQSERGLNFNGYQNSMGRSEMTVTANEQLSP
ncbi:carboxypeptidase-like regulatory domain-containing protein, partial [candidate division KSB1 bacterium]|nr:carboxypeptidase-like regulatory domain-containing protein [candidate division KSB1 bacterium]